jgi:ribosomal protein S1
VEGFIPLNQLGRESMDHPSRVYKDGDVLPAEIIEFDLESRKIVLSVEEYFKEKKDERTAHEAAFPLKHAPEAKGAGKAKAKKHEAGEEKAASVPAPAAEEVEAEVKESKE